jgi:hypothetical protein
MVLSLLEWLVNALLQFLLRKVINIALLQALLDAAADPKAVFGLARRADEPSDEPGTIVSIQWASDITVVR